MCSLTFFCTPPMYAQVICFREHYKSSKTLVKNPGVSEDNGNMFNKYCAHFPKKPSQSTWAKFRSV